jgi:opacity protein-like surface antigen
MRKFLFFLVSLLLSSSVAVAAPAYGTKMPKKNEFFGGFQYYEIFDRDLNNDNGNMKSRQEHILLSYGVTDWFALDLKASIGTIEHKAVNGTKTRYDQPVWGGGYGFRVRLYEGGPVRMVAGFQHISIHPESVRINDQKHNAILDDWQGSALVSYDLKKFTPYTGVRYGATDYLYRLNNDADRVYMDEDRRTDAVLGVDVPVNEKVWINVEGSFGAGEALAISVNFKF